MQRNHDADLDRTKSIKIEKKRTRLRFWPEPLVLPQEVKIANLGLEMTGAPADIGANNASAVEGTRPCIEVRI
jgi:hypothetical protein